MKRLGPSAAFVLSGFAGLVFEVALQRSLTRVFGVSAFATSTVLAAYMAGLALGAFLLGRVASRTRAPLRLYASLEAGIALCAVAVPALVPWLTRVAGALLQGQAPSSPTLVVVRAGVCLLVTLLPAVLMGGTLPVFVRALGDRGDASGWYTLNLLGAVLGSAAAPYLLLPGLGLSGALQVGALANVLAGALALWSMPGAGLAAPVAPPLEPGPAPGRGLLALATVSGFCVLALEVVWTHLLGVVIGTSAYAFGLMLAVFLLGLLLGGAWVSKRPGAMHVGRLALAQVLAALALALTLPLWERVPTWFALAGPAVSSFWARELVRALFAVELVLVPAGLLGVVFPGVLALAGRAGVSVAGVGRLVALNTVGAVLGSLVAGFVLLPLVGSQRLVALVATVLCAAAAPGLRGRGRALAVVVALAVWQLPAWRLGRLASGNNVYFSATGFAEAPVLFASESVGSGFTTVVSRRETGRKILLTNGKFQGSDGDELDAQRAFAQVPMLVRHGWQRALNIGVGTGTSLAVLAAQPFEHVEAAELSRDLLQAAQTHFSEVNHRVLESSRVELSVADGRNLLLLSPHRYDVICIEVSTVWFAGAADVYSRDFYWLAQQRLAPGGVLQQWVQLHHLSRRDLAVMLQSVREALPHVELFVRGGQGIVLASAQRLTHDAADLRALSQRLQGTAATEGLPGGDLLTLLGAQVLDEQGVARLVAEERAEASTDDNLLLEYSTPRGNARPDWTTAALVASLAPLRAGPPAVLGLDDEAASLHLKVALLVGDGRLDEARALADTAPAPPGAGPLWQWLRL